MLELIRENKVASIIILCAVVFITAFVIYALISSKRITKSSIFVKADIGTKLKIVHISDFHNAKFRNNNEKLLTLIKDTSPDIIAITGDLIDSRHTNVRVSIQFVSELAKIAPCYYVAGNHESRMEKEFSELKEALLNLNVTILCDSIAKYEKDKEVFTIIGIEDPMFVLKKDSLERAREVISKKLSPLASENDGYKIVLCHRPEAFEEYVKADIDLALTGHAHGGQVRIPFIGGLISPNQGFFPKYTEGLHQKSKTSMIVSRGIGNSLCPVRVNNPPEIVSIEISK